MLKKLSVLAIATLAAAQSYAHGIYFAERVQKTALVYGVGADDLQIVKRLPKIESFTAYNDDWEKVDAELKVADPMIFVDGKHAAVSAVMQNGIWSNTGEGHWIGKGRDEVPNAILSEETIKYAVFLDGPLKKIPQLPAQDLQIMPVGDSFPLLLGEMQTYQVLYRGKPVEGAMFKNDFINDTDAKPIPTDKNGMVTMPVRNQGLNVVAVTYDAPTDRPKIIDKYELLATLSFILPHIPE
ncbi:DUF4198 domain-containing protein [Alteromonas confluentis]|uniref:Nickel ABC transporter substrate-binding protein n=1 Tax=Alteromonas confluentis TaxID=1656094 RepID=A0A1E7Z705_9ALTE|nr:DUF4198 domain-containing protein [Alteromonas confluentis]OFC69211.1 nickel ABC transporter substrate-binding protein [Alteromonas confluentis]